MQQALKSKHELRLYEINKAANELFEFTENITLFQAIDENAEGVINAVNSLQSMLQKDIFAGQLFGALVSSEAAIFLDEIVDTDVMGRLEVYLLNAASNIEDPVITQFLTELIDRVELKYNRLLEKVHAYNELLIG